MFERKIYLDYLRIFACFAVLMIHVASSGRWDSTSNEWAISTFYLVLVNWCVPMFVFISGALFLDPNRTISTRILFKKYILRIVIILIFWSVIYAIMLAFRKDISLFSFVKAVLQGGEGYHLWYLYLCIGLYLLVPIFRSFTNDTEKCIYFCLLWILYWLIDIFSRIGLSEMSFFIAPFEKIEHNIFVGFAGYLVLGYLLSVVKLNKLQRFIIYFFGSLSVILSYWFGVFMSVKTNTFETITFTSFSYVLEPVSLITTSALFVFAKYNLNTYFTENVEKIVRVLSDYTLGIYLVHLLVLYIIFELLKVTIVSFNPLFSIPIITLLSFLTSSIIVYILKKMPGLKYIC